MKIFERKFFKQQKKNSNQLDKSVKSSLGGVRFISLAMAISLLLVLALPMMVLASSIPETFYEQVIPSERLLPRLVDDAGLLSAGDAANIDKRLNTISERQGLDVVIFTTREPLGMLPRDFADDIYDYGGYGMGANADGILLLVSMADRDWWITTHGYGIKAFTDAGIDYIADEFLSYMSAGDYEEAFFRFATLADKFIDQAKTGDPYDRHNLPEEPMSPFWYLVSGASGGLSGLFGAGRMKRALQSVGKKQVAGDYLMAKDIVGSGGGGSGGGGMMAGMLAGVLGGSGAETFLYDSVSKRPRATATGSSTHTSSSGRTHGGRGGKF